MAGERQAERHRFKVINKSASFVCRGKRLTRKGEKAFTILINRDQSVCVSVPVASFGVVSDAPLKRANS